MISPRQYNGSCHPTHQGAVCHAMEPIGVENDQEGSGPSQFVACKHCCNGLPFRKAAAVCVGWCTTAGNRAATADGLDFAAISALRVNRWKWI